MTTYTTLSDATLSEGQVLSEEKLKALRDNPLAMFEGASGAPRLQGGALKNPSHTSTYTYALWANDPETSTISSSWTKLKEIYVPMDGSVGVIYQGRISTGSGGHLRLYKNGVAIGTDNAFSSTSYVAKYEAAVTVAAGDLLQIYGYYVSAAALVYCAYFRLYSETAPMYFANTVGY